MNASQKLFKIEIDYVQLRAIYGKHADAMVILPKTTEEVNRRVVGKISKMDFYVWTILGSPCSRIFFQS
jgi:hypothetical protein